MAALNFPSSPVNGQVYTANGKTWIYSTSSTSWINQTGIGSQGFQGAVGFTGSRGSQGAQGSQGDQGYQGYQGVIGYTGSAGAGGGGGSPYITDMAIYNSSYSTFYSYGGVGYSPLVGYSNTSSTGAAFMRIAGSGYAATSIGSVNQIDITDSANNFTSYLSGADFNSTMGTVYVYNDIMSFYNLYIYDAELQTLFNNSETTLTTPSLAPLDAGFAGDMTNPIVRAYTADTDYDNNGVSGLGVHVSKVGSNYDLYIATGNTTYTSSITVTALEFTINGSMTFYNSGTDFIQQGSAENNSFGRFLVSFTVSNGTLQTLLDNSIR